MSRYIQDKFKGLTDAIDWSNRQLTYPRDQRLEAIRQLVGIHYFDHGANKTQPIPLLALALQIYIRQLAPRSPRSMFSTVDMSQRHVVEEYELAVNQLTKEIKLSDTLQELVLESLFSIGTVKIGLHTVGKLLDHAYGQPFVDVVTIDNLVLDMSAKRMDSIQYVGNDYWLEHEEVMESDLFPKKYKSGLSSDEFEVTNEQGNERAETIAVNETAEEFKKRLWLRDVYLPQDGIFLTYAVKSKRLLNEFEWPSREVKPYYHLGFGNVPGNLLPLSPVSLWRDLNELANALYRKLGKGADAQKSVLGFTGTGNDESILDFQAAKDGDGIKYKGTKPELLTAGGINNQTLAFFLNCKDLFSYVAGNLDSLGGLAPMTQTVGQDKLLSEAANAQMRDMASKTVGVVRDIFRALAWYEWNDPIGQRVLQRPIPGTDESIPVLWNPESREGDSSVFDLDIDPYSAQDDSPGTKLQKLGFIMQQYVLPLLPMIEAQGGNFDVQGLIQLVGKLSDFPEIKNLVSWADVEQGTGKLQATQGPKNASGQGGQGKGGMTDRGKSGVLQRLLTGDKPQQSEMENA